MICRIKGLVIQFSFVNIKSYFKEYIIYAQLPPWMIRTSVTFLFTHNGYDPHTKLSYKIKKNLIVNFYFFLSSLQIFMIIMSYFPLGMSRNHCRRTLTSAFLMTPFQVRVDRIYTSETSISSFLSHIFT